MAGRHKWADLKRRTIRPERLAAIEHDAAKEAIRLTLRELRERLGKTQVQVAKHTGSTQSWLSVLEREGPDVHISTLRNYVAALGGELELAVNLKGLGERVVVLLQGESASEIGPETAATDSMTRSPAPPGAGVRARERR